MVGTSGNVTGSRREDGYGLTKKTGPTSKQFWKSPNFERSRLSSKNFGLANSLARKIFRTVAKERRQGLFRLLLKMAVDFYQQEMNPAEIEFLMQQLANRYDVVPMPTNRRKRRSKKLVPHSWYHTDTYVVFRAPKLEMLLAKYGHDGLKKIVDCAFSKTPVVAISPPGQQRMQA